MKKKKQYKSKNRHKKISPRFVVSKNFFRNFISNHVSYFFKKINFYFHRTNGSIHSSKNFFDECSPRTNRKLTFCLKHLLVALTLAPCLTFSFPQTIGGVAIQAPTYTSTFFALIKKQKKEKNNHAEIIRQYGDCSRQFFIPTHFDSTADMQLSATPTDQPKPKLFAGFLLSALVYCLKNNAANAHRPSSPEPTTPASTSSENSNTSQASTSSDESSLVVRPQQEPLEHKNEHRDDEVTLRKKYLFEDCFTKEAEIERKKYQENTDYEDSEFIVIQQQDELSEKIIRPKKEKRILLATVHGTGSNPRSFGADENRQLSKEIINFGHYLAQHYDARVEVMPLKWSGDLGVISSPRQKAGEELADAVQKKLTSNPGKYIHIWTIAHSHGCNVVNLMAKKLKQLQPKLPITSVHIASPIAAGETKEVKHIDRCYHFYGAHDATQMAGSFIAGKGAGRKIVKTNATNICMLDDDKNLEHDTIKIPVVQNLPKLLYCIDRWYKPYTELVATTFHHPEDNLPIVYIKHLNSDELRKEKFSEIEKQEALNRDEHQTVLFEAQFNCAVREATPIHKRVSSTLANGFYDVAHKISSKFPWTKKI